MGGRAEAEHHNPGSISILPAFSPLVRASAPAGGPEWRQDVAAD